MSGDALDAARDLVEQRRGILLDWDGCLALGDLPHRDGLAFLGRHAAKVAILSNNSTLWPSDIQRVLARHGVDIPIGRIVLAGHQAVLRAAQLDLPTTVFGSPHMKALARQNGVRQVATQPDLIVLLRDTRFSYARLALGAKALGSGARLIVANPDLTHPGPMGARVPETGALLAALGACVPLDEVQVEIVGKPNAEMFHIGAAALDLQPSDAVMIGDNPATDADGARRLGMAALLVKPGSPLSLADLC